MERGGINSLKMAIVTVSLICQISVGSAATTLDVGRILDRYPKFSLLNQLLDLTGVADEINFRSNLTIFAPRNDLLSSFQAGISDSIMTDVLRHHVGTAYLEFTQLENLYHPLSVPSLLHRTLPDVNIISVTPQGVVINNTISTHVVSDITQLDTEISILEVDQVLRPVSYRNLPPPIPQPLNPFNITRNLETLSDYDIFSSYLMKTGMDLLFDGRARTILGSTIFVPSDEAFESLPPNVFNKLRKNGQRLFLEYHALNNFFTLDDLSEMVGSRLETVASTLSRRAGFILRISSTRDGGESVRIRAGQSNATIMGILYRSDTILMVSIDTVLLPHELFKHGFPLAPSPEPSAQYPVFDSPPVSESPSPQQQSPPPQVSTSPSPAISQAGARGPPIRGASSLSSLLWIKSLILSSFFFKFV